MIYVLLRSTHAFLLIFAHSMLRVDTTQKGEWLLTKVSVQITSNHCGFFGFFSLKYVHLHRKNILLMKNDLFYTKLFECEVKSHSPLFLGSILSQHTVIELLISSIFIFVTVIF